LHIDKAIEFSAKIIAVAYGLVFMYSFLTYTFDPFLQNSMLLQAVILLLMLRILRVVRSPAGKIMLVISFSVIFVSVLYISLNYVDIAYRGGIPRLYEMLLGAILISSIIILTWRIVGKPLAILALGFLLYAYLGRYIPGWWNPGEYPLSALIGYIYMTREGLWSIPLGIAATYVVAFNIVGSILSKIKATNLIIDGLSPLMRRRGGPSTVAVTSNMLLGMVSGSAPENAAITGTALMPAFKRYGVAPEKAAAVIAVAAAGALIMPPVMGAGAFIMADLLGIPYRDIAISAFIPGFLFFTSLLIYVLLEAPVYSAKYSGNGGADIMVRSLSPREALKIYGHTAIPLALLAYLIIAGYSPFRAAAYAALLSIAVAFVRRETRIRLRDLIDAFHETFDRIISMVIAISAACIIYGVIMLTGLGIKLSMIIEAASGGHLVYMLILIMLSSLVLGMGLPATVAYLIVAITIAAAVIRAGIDPLAAHLFIFYFSTFSTITPPVALALYVSSAIAGADINKAGLHALRIALPAFIVAFAFVYRPSLILRGPLEGLPVDLAFMLLSVAALAIANAGYLKRSLSLPERLAYIIAAVLLVPPNSIMNIIGIVVLGVLLLYNFLSIRKGQAH